MPGRSTRLRSIQRPESQNHWDLDAPRWRIQWAAARDKPQRQLCRPLGRVPVKYDRFTVVDPRPVIARLGRATQ